MMVARLTGTQDLSCYTIRINFPLHAQETCDRSALSKGRKVEKIFKHSFGWRVEGDGLSGRVGPPR